MYIYGLQAKGISNLNDSIVTIYSQKLFTSPEKAKAYTDSFLEKCFDTSDFLVAFDRAYASSVKIKVIMFELEE